MTLRHMVERYILERQGIRTNPSEYPCIPRIRVIDDGKSEKRPYIARTTGMGGKYGIERAFLRDDIEARSMNEGDIVEVRTYKQSRQERMYYEVRNRRFCPFVLSIPSKAWRGRRMTAGEEQLAYDCYEGQYSWETEDNTIDGGDYAFHDYDPDNPPFEDLIPSYDNDDY